MNLKWYKQLSLACTGFVLLAFTNTMLAGGGKQPSGTKQPASSSSSDSEEETEYLGAQGIPSTHVKTKKHDKSPAAVQTMEGIINHVMQDLLITHSLSDFINWYEIQSLAYPAESRRTVRQFLKMSKVEERLQTCDQTELSDKLNELEDPYPYFWLYQLLARTLENDDEFVDKESAGHRFILYLVGQHVCTHASEHCQAMAELTNGKLVSLIHPRATPLKLLSVVQSHIRTHDLNELDFYKSFIQTFFLQKSMLQEWSIERITLIAAKCGVANPDIKWIRQMRNDYEKRPYILDAVILNGPQAILYFLEHLKSAHFSHPPKLLYP